MQSNSLILFLILWLSLFNAVSSECIDTWSKISLGEVSNWLKVGDVSTNSENEWIFSRDQTVEDNTAIGGAIWSGENIAHKRGIQISFSPHIGVDTTFYGNAKYPEGFAIVFTSNAATESLIGAKGSGLGYDGLNSAVAFEFDFIRQSDKSDSKYTHFSAHYNLAGAISSASPAGCKFCNINLPNFYDDSKENYIKDLGFIIEVVSGKLSLLTNKGETILTKTTFPFLEDLMDHNEVFIGVTSSMNKNKVVTLKNFQVNELKEIASSILTLDKNFAPSQIAGTEIKMFYTIESLCKTKWKIYPNEYESFKLYNFNSLLSTTKSFDSELNALAITVESLYKVGKYSLRGDFEDLSIPGNVVDLEITSGTKLHLDLCEDVNYDKSKYTVENLETIKSSDGIKLIIPICSYDQFHNPKNTVVELDNVWLSIAYPYNVVPSSVAKIDSDWKRHVINLPIVAFGEYRIYSPNFFIYPFRTFNLVHTGVSNEYSIGYIAEHIINVAKEAPMTLKLIWKDQFSNQITNEKLNELDCKFDESKVLEYKNDGTSTESSVTIDLSENLPKFSFAGKENGNFTFIPMVKCEGNHYYYPITCPDCTFYISDTTIDNKRAKFYSDYYQQWFFSDEINSESNPLYITLEEYSNSIITKMSFVDKSGLDYTLDWYEKQNKVTLDSEFTNNAEGKINPAGYIEIVLLNVNENNPRGNLVLPFKNYNFHVLLTSDDKSIIDLKIYIQFIYKSEFMNNVDKIDKAFSKCLSIFRPKTLELVAGNELLLFSLYALNEYNRAIVINDIELGDWTVLLNETGLEITSIKTETEVLVSTKSLQIAGEYPLTFKYKDGSVTQNIKVLNQPKVDKLLFDESDPRINTCKINEEGTTEIVLNNIDIDTIISFPMTMVDQFNNPIWVDPHWVFSTITYNANMAEAKPQYNGQILIIGDTHIPGIQEVQLHLPNKSKSKYTIKWQRNSKVIDQGHSYAITSASQKIEENVVTVTIELRDMYNNRLADIDISSQSDMFSVYAYKIKGERYNIEKWSYKQSDISEITFEGYVTTSGQYEVMVFYENIPIKNINSQISFSAYNHYDKVSLDYISNNDLYPIFNDDRYMMVDKDTNFAFFINLLDKNNDKTTTHEEYKDITLISEESSSIHISITSEYSNNFMIYQARSSDELQKWPDGKYSMDIKGQKYKIYWTTSNTMYDTTSASISKDNSFIVQHDNVIHGYTDIPGTFIWDLRSNSNLRIPPSDVELNLIKIELLNVDEDKYSSNCLFGSNKGLITCMISCSILGKNTFKVLYDNNVIVEEYTLMIYPGRVNKIEYSSMVLISEGEYIKFEAKDAYGNICNLNELANENFLTNIMSIQSQTTDVLGTYYYNAIEGIISVKLDQVKTKRITITSSFLSGQLGIDLEDRLIASGEQVLFNIYDNNNNESEGKVRFSITVFDKNYQRISDDSIGDQLTNAINMIVLKTENDKTSLLFDYKNLTIINNAGLYVDVDVMEGGDLLFIPYYKNLIASCGNCRKVKSSLPEPNWDKTKIYYKNGVDEWLEKGAGFNKMIYNKDLPVFKINLYDSNDSLIKENLKDWEVKVLTKSDANDAIFETEQYPDRNGDLYVYLTSNGRMQYQQLPSLTELKVSINNREYGGFFILKSKIDNPPDTICKYDATPTIVSNQEYTVRADQEKFIEIVLVGCESQVDNYINVSQFKVYENDIIITDDSERYKFITGERRGHYLLSIKESDITNSMGNKVYKVQYKNSTLSSDIVVHVIPGYEISTLEITKYPEGESDVWNTSNIYAYFKIIPKDSEENIITTSSNNIYFNNLYVKVTNDKEENMPYKITYKRSGNSDIIIGQIPISTSGVIKVTSLIDETQTLDIPIEMYKEYTHSTSTISISDDVYKVNIQIRDKWNNLKDFEKPAGDFLFYYYTYNTLTNDEILLKVEDSSITNDDKGLYTITLPTYYPVYHYSTIIVKDNMNNELLNTGNLIMNDKWSYVYIYSVSLSKYVVSNPWMNKYMLHYIEYPLYLYESSKSIYTSENPSWKMHYKIISNKDSKFNTAALGYNSIEMVSQSPPSEVKLSLTNSESIILYINTIKTVTENDANADKSQISATNVVSYITGDWVYFYIEARTEQGELTKKTFVVSVEDWNSHLKSTVVPTSTLGRYLVIIPSEKLFWKTTYNLKIEDVSSDKYIFFFGLSKYPIALLTKDKYTDYNWNVHRYTVEGSDEYNNMICDSRLGFYYIRNEIYFKDKIKYLLTGNTCYIYIEIIGQANLITNIIADYNIVLNNINEVLINSFYSTFSVTPRIMAEDSLVNMDFKVKTYLKEPYTPLVVYVGIKIYKYISPTRIDLISEWNGWYDWSNSFRPSNYQMQLGNNYIIIGSINDIDVSDIVNWRYYLPEQFEANNIKASLYKNGETTLIGYTAIDLAYPYEIHASILSENGMPFQWPANFYMESTMYRNKDDTDIWLSWETVRIDDSEFIISIGLDSVNTYLHYPKGNKYINLALKWKDETEGIKELFNRTIELNYLDGDSQYNINGFNYLEPNIPLADSNNFINNENTWFALINKGAFTKTIFCIHPSNENKIYNFYLDTSKLVIENEASLKIVYKSISYRGCFDIYIYGDYNEALESFTVTYDEKIMTQKLEVTYNSEFPYTSVTVEKKFDEQVDEGVAIWSEFQWLSKAQASIIVNDHYFKLFWNGIILSNDKQTISESDNSMQININGLAYPPNIYHLETYFFYENELTKITELSQEITVKQEIYLNTNTKLVLPQHYLAGNEIVMYLLLINKNFICYDTEVEDISVSIGDYSNFTYELTTLNQGITVCNTMYKITSKGDTISKTGTYDVNIKPLEFNTQFNVLPYNISNTKATLQVMGYEISPFVTIQAGDPKELRLTGTDRYDNKINFYDLINNFNFELDGLVKDTDYSVSFSATDDYLLINLEVITMGIYKVKLLIYGDEFENENGLKELTVLSGKCDKTHPSVEIDNPNYYPGDSVEFIIQCKDKYGNDVTKKGDEQFALYIKGFDLEIVGEDTIPYILEYNEGKYKAIFDWINVGKYNVTVYWNGWTYGEEYVLVVNSDICNKNFPIQCQNKICTDDISKCKPFPFESTCSESEIKEGKIYTFNGICYSADELPCPEGYDKCDGRCLPLSDSYCQVPKKSNCEVMARAKYGEKEIISLDDGSCRIQNDNLNYLPNDLTCPLGYIPLNEGCVRYDNSNNFNITITQCPSNMIRCWDLSCEIFYENCPTRKTCYNKTDKVCPDGTCVEKGSYCPQYGTCSGTKPIQCSDMTCEASLENCNKKVTCDIGLHLCANNQCKEKCEESDQCNEGQKLCPNGQCISNTQMCPTEMFCPTNYIKCANGACASSISECNYYQGIMKLTCPLSAPIWCPDLSCKVSSDECTSVPQCPFDSPYVCWNNECRKRFEDCPTEITCPKDYPIHCTDGTCQKGVYHCSNQKDSSFCDDSLVRCAGGECASSITLCPTHTTCPKSLIKCWNGSCVPKPVSDSDELECPPSGPIVCSDSMNPYWCPDGSCRFDRDSCSTISVCPPERPVKCYDNSCMTTIDACPDYQTCGKNMKSCPDGTCADSYEDCSTLVTCKFDRPFWCWDGSCQILLEDCPPQPWCDNKVLCPFGNCATNRQNCKYFGSCSDSTPIRCSKNWCVYNANECDNFSNQECPIGFWKCKNGQCRASESDCDVVTCPPHKPYLCKEGVCVPSSEYCDKDNGCPYNWPFKCQTGRCVTNLNLCVDVTPSEYCPGQYWCPDGSCNLESTLCPLVNGCPKEKPQKCADGHCINPTTSSCLMPLCPFATPFQCQNGNCYAQSSLCTITSRVSDYTDCGDNMFMCSDGRCVPSNDMCRPNYACPNVYSKCNDGTCRIAIETCPKESNCPEIRPVRCSNGHCAYNDEGCINDNICPINYDRKEWTGECMVNGLNPDDYPKESVKFSGCTNPDYIKCPDGRCMSNLDMCIITDISCNELEPYLCPNGECKEDEEKCDESTDCPEGKDRCTSGLCVVDLKKDCPMENGCPISSPYRCANGECVTNWILCNPTVSCEDNEQYLCSDFTCVSNSKYCNTRIPCNATLINCNGQMIICNTTSVTCDDEIIPCMASYVSKNNYCLKHEDEIKATELLCPRTVPLKCPNGKCVKDMIECSQSFPTKSCNSDEFYCLLNFKCVISVEECIGKDYVSGVTSPPIQLRVRGLGIEVENQCNEDYPYSNYDGSCVNDKTLRKFPPACGLMEYRCHSGLCTADKAKCGVDSAPCVDGWTKCLDGLCRRECPSYSGCQWGLWQCTNGMCVKDIDECIGYSMCDRHQTPYRCMNGNCVMDPLSCPDIERLIVPESIEYSFTMYDTFAFNFAYNNLKNPIGSFRFPGNGFIMKGNKEHGMIKISGVLQSDFDNITYYNNTQLLMFNISNGIIASDGMLTYENALMSTIISITSNDIEPKFRAPATISIVYNSLSSDIILNGDYCLSKLNVNDKRWDCVSRDLNLNGQFSFNELGTYAVVLNPMRQKSTWLETENFFWENIKIMAIVLGVTIIVGMLIFYIFSRVTRYRIKYLETLEKINYLQQQKSEYELMSTDIFGQTWGDNLWGLVFTKNNCYSVEELSNNGNMTLEEEIEFLENQCHNMEIQNKNLEGNIEKQTEMYQDINSEVEKLKEK